MLADQHSPEAILAALRYGVDYSFTIKIRALTLRARVLSIVERIAILNDVSAEMAKKPAEEQNMATQSSLLAIRILERATTDSPEDTRAPRLPAAISTQLSTDELSALYKAYEDACAKLDPAMETIPLETATALVEAAKKNDTVLTEWPRPHLEAALRFLLDQDAREVSMSGGSSGNASKAVSD